MTRFASTRCVVAFGALASMANAQPAAEATAAQPATPPAASAVTPAQPATPPAADAATTAQPAAAPAADAATSAQPATAPAATPAVRPVITPIPVQLAETPPDRGPASLPKGPLDSHFTIRVDFNTVWYTARSYDLVSDRDPAMYVGVSVGYTLFRFDRLSLIPELGFNANHVGSTELFGGAVSRTGLTSENVYAGVGARYDLFSILDLGARISGGATFAQFEMQPNGANAVLLEDDGVAPFFAAGGGFTIHTAAGAFETKGGSLRSLVGGLSFEGGYLLAGSIPLRPAPENGNGRVDTSYTSLGNLDRSGPYFQVSLSGRF
jgi:hypothetical protein